MDKMSDVVCKLLWHTRNKTLQGASALDVGVVLTWVLEVAEAKLELHGCWGVMLEEEEEELPSLYQVLKTKKKPVAYFHSSRPY